MGLSVKWDITYKCNLNCNHCVNGHHLNNNDEELSTTEIKKLIDKLASRNIDYIHLLGGEPTFLKDFYDIMNYFFEKKIPVGFNTNGLKLATSKMKELIKSNYLEQVVVSIEGPTAEINDQVRGINVFHKTVSNLREIVKFKRENNLNVKFAINTVLSKVNYYHVNEMIALAIDIGVDEINLLSYIFEGNASEGEDIRLQPADEINIIKDIASIYPTIKEKIKINPKFTFPLGVEYCREVLEMEFPGVKHGCGAGTSFAFLNNKGDLYPCDRYKAIVDRELSSEKINLNKLDFYSIWDQEVFAQPFTVTMGDSIYKNFEPCNTCKHLRVACFPCPVYGLDGEPVKLKNCLKFQELIDKKVGEKVG